MIDERIDWEKNHGKILHEYTLYDFIKKVPELNITNYSKEKSVKSITFDPILATIKINYIDENNNDQTVMINCTHVNKDDKTDFTNLHFHSASDNRNVLYSIDLFKNGVNNYDYRMYDTILHYLLQILRNNEDVKNKIKEIVRG